MNKKFLYILPLVAVISTSCVEDEGNYNYVDLNEITIEGIGGGYNLLSYIDTLKIEPELSSTVYGDNLDKYSFDWHICSGILSTNGDVHSHTFISDEKDLVWPANIVPGNYTVYFTVTDKANGIETQTYTSIQVTSSMSRGFLFLGEIGGTERIGLDMLTMVPGRDSVLVEGAFDSYYEGLANPKMIFHSGYNNGGETYGYLMTEDETWALSMEDENQFQPTQLFSSQGRVETDYEVKRPLTLRNVFPNGAGYYYGSPYQTLCKRARYYMCDDIVFGGMTMVSYENQVFLSQAYNRYSSVVGSPLFNFYPYLFVNYSNIQLMYPQAWLYDTDSDCFAQCGSLLYSYNSTKLTYPNTPWSFDLRSEGRKLLFGESGKSGLSYMVVKGDDGKYFIYTIQFPSTGKALYEVDFSVAKDFDKASFYAFSSARRTLLYSVGNKVYNYDYTTNNASVTEFDGEITYLHPEFESNFSQYEYIIATWNNSTKKGKISKFDVNVAPDDLTLYPRDNEEWETRLKIKDIRWFRK